MYRLWYPASELNRDRPMMLVADDLDELAVNTKGRRAGAVRQVTAGKNGQLTWRLYYRILR